MDKSIIVKIKENIFLSLPGLLNNLSTFVCLEQEDWFENEIKFIRNLINPGMRIIDIGANYGIYSLTMAKLTGTEGIVWACEPDLRLVPFLTESIKKNNLHNIFLKNIALTDHSGKINFNLSVNSELNSISFNPQIHSEGVEVECFTIDSCMEKFGWQNIDFIKIDAEGEEINIFKGALRFLQNESPLIMFECSAIDYEVLHEYISDFKYEIYKLIPGLNILVPIKSQISDPYQLNLFCCKPEMAEKLEKKGLLARETLTLSNFPVEPKIWIKSLKDLPYTTNLMERWIRNTSNTKNPDRNKYLTALNYYCMAKYTDLSPSQKYYFLNQALEEINTVDKLFSDINRLQTMIRILLELGKREKAVNIIKVLIEKIKNESKIDIREPFIPISAIFESIVPDRNLKNWCMTAFIEEFIKLSTFSSFFLDLPLDYLNMIENKEFMSNEMKRRKNLAELLKNNKPRISLSDKNWCKPEYTDILPDCN